MNLFERLMYRRLCSEASPEGGDGGAAQLLQQPAITGQQLPMQLIRGGWQPEGEGKQEGGKTAEEIAAEKTRKRNKEAAEKAERIRNPRRRRNTSSLRRKAAGTGCQCSGCI